jgi:hypothetical protein
VRIAPPLRIAAAVAGVALAAVPFVVGATRHAPPPPPRHAPRVAVFRVGDHDLGTFWPVPGAAGR